MHRARELPNVDGPGKVVHHKVRLSWTLGSSETLSTFRAPHPNRSDTISSPPPVVFAPSQNKGSFGPLTPEQPATVKGHTHVEHTGCAILVLGLLPPRLDVTRARHAHRQLAARAKPLAPWGLQEMLRVRGLQHLLPQAAHSRLRLMVHLGDALLRTPVRKSRAQTCGGFCRGDRSPAWCASMDHGLLYVLRAHGSSPFVVWCAHMAHSLF